MDSKKLKSKKGRKPKKQRDLVVQTSINGAVIFGYDETGKRVTIASLVKADDLSFYRYALEKANAENIKQKAALCLKGITDLRDLNTSEIRDEYYTCAAVISAFEFLKRGYRVKHQFNATVSRVVNKFFELQNATFIAKEKISKLQASLNNNSDIDVQAIADKIKEQQSYIDEYHNLCNKYNITDENFLNCPNELFIKNKNDAFVQYKKQILEYLNKKQIRHLTYLYKFLPDFLTSEYNSFSFSEAKNYGVLEKHRNNDIGLTGLDENNQKALGALSVQDLNKLKSSLEISLKYIKGILKSK